MATPTRGAAYAVSVYDGQDLRAVAGANQGDGITVVEDLALGDMYRLRLGATAQRLTLNQDRNDGTVARSVAILSGPNGRTRIAETSAVGTSGATLTLAARLTFLATNGHSVDAMALRPEDAVPPCLLFPLGPLQGDMEYMLAGLALSEDLPADALRLTDVAPFGFAAGTRITLADGTQRTVEQLRDGDRVLTRDNGPQPLRMVLMQTLRAVGPDAPVVIAAETMGNPGDLILSRHQRLLVYQRGDDRLTDTAELLIRAGDLVDDTVVFTREGGFVDYVTLVLDHHEMLFAECVAVESLEVGEATRRRLTEEHARAVEGLSHTPHFGTDAGRDIAAAARARLLRPKE